MFWPDDTQDCSLTSATVHWGNDFENQPVMIPRPLSGICISVTAGIYISGFSVMQRWIILLFPSCTTFIDIEIHLSAFFPTHSVIWGFPGDSYNLWMLSTQDRLAGFTVHCLSLVIAEHSQHWHGQNWRQSDGAVAPGPLQSPLVHRTYPGLWAPSILWWPHGPTNPLDCFLPRMPLGDSLSYSSHSLQSSSFFFFFFTFTFLGVWAFLFPFFGPDFQFLKLLFHVRACITFQLKFEGIFWTALFSFWMVALFLPGF